jgi:hypothetical protein
MAYPGIFLIGGHVDGLDCAYSRDDECLFYKVEQTAGCIKTESTEWSATSPTRAMKQLGVGIMNGQEFTALLAKKPNLY